MNALAISTFKPIFELPEFNYSILLQNIDAETEEKIPIHITCLMRDIPIGTPTETTETIHTSGILLNASDLRVPLHTSVTTRNYLVPELSDEARDYLIRISDGEEQTLECEGCERVFKQKNPGIVKKGTKLKTHCLYGSVKQIEIG